eukprot:TCONS_00047870-protein
MGVINSIHIRVNINRLCILGMTASMTTSKPAKPLNSKIQQVHHICLTTYKECSDKWYCFVDWFCQCKSKYSDCCDEAFQCEKIEPKCSGKYCEIINPKYRDCLKDSLRCPLARA